MTKIGPTFTKERKLKIEVMKKYLIDFSYSKFNLKIRILMVVLPFEIRS